MVWMQFADPFPPGPEGGPTPSTEKLVRPFVRAVTRLPGGPAGGFGQ